MDGPEGVEEEVVEALEVARQRSGRRRVGVARPAVVERVKEGGGRLLVLMGRRGGGGGH